MTVPRPGDLAHDLRNLFGLIRANTNTVLTAAMPQLEGEAREAADDLASQTRFALEALRVVERWESAEPAEFSVGAWAWALRLTERRLVLDEMTGTPTVRAGVLAAMSAGRALVAAISAGRTLRVERVAAGGVRFVSAARAVDADGLAAALAALRTAGVPATVESEVPCRVVVG
jgi:hypothetical protein